MEGAAPSAPGAGRVGEKTSRAGGDPRNRFHPTGPPQAPTERRPPVGGGGAPSTHGALTPQTPTTSPTAMPGDDPFAEDRRRRLAAGLQRALRPIDGPQDTRVIVDGRAVLSLCSNNYLGLANHPEVVEAAVAAARELGVGSGASRLISGSMRSHHDLEQRLAGFKGAEACLL